MESEGVGADLRKERLDILNQLWQAYRAEESRWLQKTRIRWLKVGDRNSNFFHRVCKVRDAKKNIHNLAFNGTHLSDPNAIKRAVFLHFQNFFKRGRKACAVLKCPNMHRLSHTLRDMLEAPFTKQEIWDTIRSCDGNRAPGPNGFNLTFFKEFCNLVKLDVIKMFHEFHKNGKLVR